MMTEVREIPRFTVVYVGDDDNGYYILNPLTNERLDIRFNTPHEVVCYAHSEYLVIACDGDV